ncbi:hypothetical protein ACFQ0O_01385 [Saccharopolyspora spinosporotrichia]
MATGDTGRGAAVIRWRNWSLTTKLAAVVLVPVIFAITLGVGQIRWQVDRADEYDRVAKVLDAVDQIEPLVVSVQEERTRSVDFLTGSIDAGKVDEQAVVVDAAVRGTRQVMASPRTTATWSGSASASSTPSWASSTRPARWSGTGGPLRPR